LSFMRSATAVLPTCADVCLANSPDISGDDGLT
jgi:hypothetical protein